MNRRHEDSAGAAAPADSGDLDPQPEQAGEAEPLVERHERADTLDVVPAVGAGAALGAKRVR